MPEFIRAPFTEEVLQEMEAAFRQPRITPGVSDREIMYNAGKQAVLEWCKEKQKRATGGHVCTPVNEQ